MRQFKTDAFFVKYSTPKRVVFCLKKELMMTKVIYKLLMMN
jgi:hypothetical protein